MEKLHGKNVPVLDINLRSISHPTAKIEFMGKDFEEISRRFHLDASAYDIRFGATYEMHQKPIANMPLLAKLSGLLDHFSTIQLQPPPLLAKMANTCVHCIDEASELRTLKEDFDGVDFDALQCP